MALTVRYAVSVDAALSPRIATLVLPAFSVAPPTKPLALRPTHQVRITQSLCNILVFPA